jgi:hypothetical protein
MGALFQDGLAEGTVGRNITLTLTSAPRPCWGGVEYLHRGPSSRRRRRKGNSQIWDSKIWSRVAQDSDPRMNALARASIIYKRKTRLLVREGAPKRQDRDCQTVINIWSWAPDGARHQDWLTDRQSQCDFDKILLCLMGSSVAGYSPDMEDILLLTSVTSKRPWRHCL